MRLRVVASSAQQQPGALKKNVRSGVNPLVQKRVDMIREDLKAVYDQRVSSLNAVDVSMRDIVTKEAELRQQIVDKWVSIAKDDITKIMENCKCGSGAGSKETIHVVDGEIVVGMDSDADSHVVSPPPAAEAFYEPWVKDD